MPIQSSFCVTGIDTIPSLKKIVIETNFKIDEATVNFENIKLYNMIDGNMDIITPKQMYVEDFNVVMMLDQYPRQDSKYYLIVKNLKDKLGRTLYNIYDRYIYFDYEITTKVNIQMPIDQEVFKTKDIEIKIAISDENEETKYRFEISSDIAFLDKDSVVFRDNNHETFLSDKENYKVIGAIKDGNNINLLINFKNDGQYYLRARAENSHYIVGSWSEIITFKVASATPVQDFTGYLDDFLLPNELFKEDFIELKQLNKTLDATTGQDFYIEFNKKIKFTQDLESKYSPEGLLYIGKAYLTRRDY